MNWTFICIILAMALVTFVPRVIPAAFVDKIRFGPKLEKYLKLIPYTAMAALVFPGVLFVDAGNPIIGVVGGATAVILAYFRVPLIFCVLAAIGVDIVLYLVF
jgi:Predicted membrane protein